MYAHRLITVLYTGIKQKNVSEILYVHQKALLLVLFLTNFQKKLFFFFKYSMVEIFQSEAIRENKKKAEMFTV